ncbi:MAG: hypothetical protein WC729_11590 [Sphingomonas sp.]|jgi:acetolactate synthase regulatory subunit|uniref:hypothetical protein n=1 Tax=Sphingomonas sp. TaxID=28214 RepID=UPI003564A323
MVRFTISAQVADDILLRILNHFAQRGLCPSRVQAVRVGDTMIIDIEQPRLDEQAASIIQEKMRNCIDVATVAVTRLDEP